MTTFTPWPFQSSARAIHRAAARGWKSPLLADIRSTPYSRRHPQFSKPVLAETLPAGGNRLRIPGRGAWRHAGETRRCCAMARPTMTGLPRRSRSGRGWIRVIDGASRHRIALMCAEREPLDCHRFLLVSRHLALRGARINHILGDGSIEEHDDTLRRLLAKTHLDAGELFAGRNAARRGGRAGFCGGAPPAFRRQDAGVPRQHCAQRRGRTGPSGAAAPYATSAATDRESMGSAHINSCRGGGPWYQPRRRRVFRAISAHIPSP